MNGQRAVLWSAVVLLWLCCLSPTLFAFALAPPESGWQALGLGCLQVWAGLFAVAGTVAAIMYHEELAW